MLVVIATNPVLDNDIYVHTLMHKQDINPLKSSFTVGGTSINIASIAQLLNTKTLLLGFVAGPVGALIRSALTQDKIAHYFINIYGNSRICINIFETNSESQTCIHQHETVKIAPDQLNKFLRIYRKCIQRHPLCVISGSLPQSMPSSLYADLISIAHTYNVPCILDTSGDALRTALQARPEVVKINQIEAAEFVGHRLDSIADVLHACRALINVGTTLAIITCGEKGAVVYEANKQTGYHIIPPRLQATNTVGCGDAFAAAFAVGLLRNQSRSDCYRFATAVASAAALQARPGRVDSDDIEKIIPQITMKEIQA